MSITTPSLACFTPERATNTVNHTTGNVARVTGKLYVIFGGRVTTDTKAPATPVITMSTLETVSTVSPGLFDDTGATQRKGFVAWFIASGTGNGTVNLTYADTSATNFSDVMVVEVGNVNATQLAQALVVAVSLNANWPSNLSTATLGSTVTAGNATLAFHYGAAQTRTGTATSGFTALTQYNSATTDRYLIEYAVAGIQTTSMNWGGTEPGAAWIIEVTALASATAIAAISNYYLNQ